MSTKYDVPVTYYDEANQYMALVTLVGRTSTGNVTFLSSSSGVTYTSTTGQDGILSQLQTALADYMIDATAWNGITTQINNGLSTLTTNLNNLQSYVDDELFWKMLGGM